MVSSRGHRERSGHALVAARTLVADRRAVVVVCLPARRAVRLVVVAARLAVVVAFAPDLRAEVAVPFAPALAALAVSTAPRWAEREVERAPWRAVVAVRFVLRAAALLVDWAVRGALRSLYGRDGGVGRAGSDLGGGLPGVGGAGWAHPWPLATQDDGDEIAHGGHAALSDAAHRVSHPVDDAGRGARDQVARRGVGALRVRMRRRRLAGSIQRVAEIAQGIDDRARLGPSGRTRCSSSST